MIHFSKKIKPHLCFVFGCNFMFFGVNYILVDCVYN
jgi:hypothetical protein